MKILKALNLNEYSVLKSVDSCIKIIKHCSQLWEFTITKGKQQKYFSYNFTFLGYNYKSISIAIYQNKKKVQGIQYNIKMHFFYYYLHIFGIKCSLKTTFYWGTFCVTNTQTTMHFMYEVYFFILCRFCCCFFLHFLLLLLMENQSRSSKCIMHHWKEHFIIK